jgi:hypothetical protein
VEGGHRMRKRPERRAGETKIKIKIKKIIFVLVLILGE